MSMWGGERGEGLRDMESERRKEGKANKSKRRVNKLVNLRVGSNELSK